MLILKQRIIHDHFGFFYEKNMEDKRHKGVNLRNIKKYYRVEHSVGASSKNIFPHKGIFLSSYLTERSSDNDVSLSQDHNYVQELRGHNRRK